jgi:hypothetical protein
MPGLPGERYFKMTMINGDNTVRVVVWDGIRHYENEPLVPNICALEKMDSSLLTIVQTRRGREVVKIVNRVLGSGNDLIIWTRDHKTYCEAVDEMSNQPNVVYATPEIRQWIRERIRNEDWAMKERRRRAH